MFRSREHPLSDQNLTAAGALCVYAVTRVDRGPTPSAASLRACCASIVLATTATVARELVIFDGRLGAASAILIVTPTSA